MVRLREIPRTATFAWSTGAVSPQLVTGTKAGAVDADFSNETVLELWDLDLGNTSSPNDLQPAGTLNVDSRYSHLRPLTRVTNNVIDFTPLPGASPLKPINLASLPER